MTKLFSSALQVNREKLAAEMGSYQTSKDFFFNSFVSQILYNKDQTEFNVQKECEGLLAKVAIVDISLINSDAILIEKTIRDSGDLLTFIGGLLSLYAGFSFLSLAELVFWIFSGFVGLGISGIKYGFNLATSLAGKN